ncbi:MAG: hypothetical protein MHPSP_000867 [Paramarteilia canceri]
MIVSVDESSGKIDIKVNYGKMLDLIESELQDEIKYELENSAKIRAIHQNTENYEQFRQLVAGSNLKPKNVVESLDESKDFKLGRLGDLCKDIRVDFSEKNLNSTIFTDVGSINMDERFDQSLQLILADYSLANKIWKCSKTIDQKKRLIEFLNSSEKSLNQKNLMKKFITEILIQSSGLELEIIVDILKETKSKTIKNKVCEACKEYDRFELSKLFLPDSKIAILNSIINKY